jgi:hypothetical protein
MASDEAGMSVGESGRSADQRDVLAILQKGRPGTTMCPSDVARKLDPVGWRALMPDVRAAAFSLADAGLVEVTHRGVVVDGRTARGAIRLRAVARPDEP